MNIALNSVQWKSIGKDAILFMVGLAITIIYQQVSGTSLGDAAPIAMGVFALVANYIHRVYGVAIPAAIDTTPEPATPAPPTQETK